MISARLIPLDRGRMASLVASHPAAVLLLARAINFLGFHGRRAAIYTLAVSACVITVPHQIGAQSQVIDGCILCGRKHERGVSWDTVRISGCKICKKSHLHDYIKGWGMPDVLKCDLENRVRESPIGLAPNPEVRAQAGVERDPWALRYIELPLGDGYAFAGREEQLISHARVEHGNKEGGDLNRKFHAVAGVFLIITGAALFAYARRGATNPVLVFVFILGGFALGTFGFVLIL